MVHWHNLSISFWIISKSSRFSRSLYNLASFANSLQKELTSDGKSFTYNMNNKGPRTEPWGTPLDTSVHSDDIPFMSTRCWRSVKKSLINFKRFPDIPSFSIFISSCLCGTQSKAFLKSRKTASTGVSESINFDQSSNTFSNCSIHPLLCSSILHKILVILIGL